MIKTASFTEGVAISPLPDHPASLSSGWALPAPPHAPPHRMTRPRSAQALTTPQAAPNLARFNAVVSVYDMGGPFQEELLQLKKQNRLILRTLQRTAAERDQIVTDAHAYRAECEAMREQARALICTDAGPPHAHTPTHLPERRQEVVRG